MTPARARKGALHAAALPVAVLVLACAGTPEPDPRYRPAESVLEVVAVLRRHVPDDTYRFEPARDFTGRNVYRASLLRLENLEQVHEDALRAGTLDDVIAFAKGRALERIRAYELAAASYRRAAEREGPLRLDALGSAALNDALAEAASLEEPDLEDREDPPPVEAAPPALERAAEAAAPAELPAASARDAALRVFDTRAALLEALLPDSEGTHYRAIVREEIERVDVERAGYMVDTRHLFEDGDLRALGGLQQVVVSHRESKNANAHLLSLADLYAELAVEYVELHPPEALTFDPPRFRELVEAASRLYEAVSNQDGAPEKLEAARRLEAFIAFTLKVDRDRFSP